MDDNNLVFEVPFKDGEKERFLRYVDNGAYDLGKIVRKLLMKQVETHEKLEKLAALRERRAASAERSKTANSADQEVNHLADK
jgi:hypothetical protein